eukprot:g1609.t1
MNAAQAETMRKLLELQMGDLKDETKVEDDKKTFWVEFTKERRKLNKKKTEKEEAKKKKKERVRLTREQKLFLEVKNIRRWRYKAILPDKDLIDEDDKTMAPTAAEQLVWDTIKEIDDPRGSSVPEVKSYIQNVLKKNSPDVALSLKHLNDKLMLSQYGHVGHQRFTPSQSQIVIYGSQTCAFDWSNPDDDDEKPKRQISKIWKCCMWMPDEMARLKNVKMLSISNTSLRELPPSWASLAPNLVTLTLSNNSLTYISSALSRCVNLEALLLNGNQLEEIPPLNKLKKLRKLMVGNNLLRRIPSGLKTLPVLHQLVVSSNLILSLPRTIGYLTELRYLGVAKNQLTELPSTLQKLQKITKLDFSGNRLETVPEALGKLVKLRFLDLSENKLHSLHENIDKNTALYDLNLRKNKLSLLPACVLTMTQLTKIDLKGNPMSEPQQGEPWAIPEDLHYSKSIMAQIKISKDTFLSNE